MDKKAEKKALANAQRSVRSYIGAVSVLLGTLMSLALIAAAGLIGTGLYYAMNTTEFNSLYSKKESRAFIDAVAVSDWVYKYEQGGEKRAYYTAVDNDGYMYIFSMDPEQFGALSEQNAEYNSEEKNPDARAYRLFGKSREMTPMVLTDIAEIWGYPNDDEFVKYFGDRYLDVSNVRSKGIHYPLLLGGAVSVFALLAMLAYCLPASMKASRSLKALKAKGLMLEAGNELDALEGSADGECCAATQHFLFGRGNGFAMPYSDILWFYQKPGGKKYKRIIVNTADKQNINAVTMKSVQADQTTQFLATKILNANPNALYGPGKELRELYRELCSKHRKEA